MFVFGIKLILLIIGKIVCDFFYEFKISYYYLLVKWCILYFYRINSGISRSLLVISYILFF